MTIKLYSLAKSIPARSRTSRLKNLHLGGIMNCVSSIVVTIECDREFSPCRRSIDLENVDSVRK